MNKPKILIFDIETALLLAYLFSTGKQYVGHSQLQAGHNMWAIICINYCWADGGSVKTIAWTPEGGVEAMIAEFDEIIKTADLVVGKNSDRFDNPMINACRMFAGLPGLPDWIKYTDDLETQMRRHFRLPSQSLDYISTKLGLGGKIKMEFSDWIAIHRWMEMEKLHLAIRQESGAFYLENILDIICKNNYNEKYEVVMAEGKAAMAKMCKYGRKDTADTRTLWNTLSEHFDSKFNMATFVNDGSRCKHADCGSENIKKNGTRVSGKTVYQTYLCGDCGRYAGRTTVSRFTGKEGTIG